MAGEGGGPYSSSRKTRSFWHEALLSSSRPDSRKKYSCLAQPNVAASGTLKRVSQNCDGQSAKARLRCGDGRGPNAQCHPILRCSSAVSQDRWWCRIDGGVGQSFTSQGPPLLELSNNFSWGGEGVSGATNSKLPNVVLIGKFEVVIFRNLSGAKRNFE